MEIWTKGGPINVSCVSAIILLVISFSILYLIFQADTKQHNENIKLADEAEVSWATYTIPEGGIKIPYKKYSTGTQAEEPFLVPQESDARVNGKLIMAILPKNVKLIDELAYSHGAGKTTDGCQRIIIRLPN